MLSEITQAVLLKHVSATELVRRSLDRIERVDNTIHSVIRVRADQAIAEARALDERLARGEEVGALAGIPFLVKDVEDLKGLPTTFGSLLYSDAQPAPSDGTVPARLRASDAIPVGMTNVPEFAVEGFTDNRLFGPTGNPWALEWSPGGSSGGSAAAMAAGIVPLATATDGGGSVRVPAALCGLAGLKPTNGLIGRDPIPDWVDLSTQGALGYSAEDLRLLLGIMKGPVTGDPTAVPSWDIPRSSPPSCVVASSRWYSWGPIAPNVSKAFELAVDRLAGALSVPVETPSTGTIFDSMNPDLDWYTIAGPEHAHRLGARLIESASDRLHQSTRQFLEDGLRVSIEDYLAARRRRFEHARAVDDLLGPDKILVQPTLTLEGWYRDGRVPGSGDIAPPMSAYNTFVQNLTGHPALSLPAGVLPSGIPFGMQITAPRFREDILFGACETWEQVEPWPSSAPGFKPFFDGR